MAISAWSRIPLCCRKRRSSPVGITADRLCHRDRRARIWPVPGALGAGRERKGDPIDPAVGLVLHAKVGHACEQGEPL